MINPYEINFVTLNCFVPSSFFSGSLIQLVSYLQNMNLKTLIRETFWGYCTVLLVCTERALKRLSSLKTFRPLDPLRQKRIEYKKDFHSW